MTGTADCLRQGCFTRLTGAAWRWGWCYRRRWGWCYRWGWRCTIRIVAVTQAITVIIKTGVAKLNRSKGVFIARVDALRGKSGGWDILADWRVIGRIGVGVATAADLHPGIPVMLTQSGGAGL